MRGAAVAGTGLGALALLTFAPAAPARSPRPHSCRPVRVSAGEASHVRTTYRCRYARRTLGVLLHRGVRGLPRGRATRRRFGCSLKGSVWTCNRLRSHRRPGTIAFEFKVRPAKAHKPPAPGPAPPAVSPVQRCIDLWNGDSVIVANVGYHLAVHHLVTRVWVFELPAQAFAGPRCAVIAVVPETDPEFGNDGAVSAPAGGWILMASVGELGDAVDVQRRAAGSANASMQPDGHLALP